MTDTHRTDELVPLVEERLHVGKRTVEAGRVRIRTTVEERQAWIREDLEHEEVSIERVPVGREVEAVPEIRREGDVLVVPIVEEIVVVEKRLVLREELHVRKQRRTEHVEEPVTLRAAKAVIEREETHGQGNANREHRSTR